MVKKTLRKNKKSFRLSGGSNVWNDILKLSIVPSMNKKIGGNKKTSKKHMLKPIGIKNANNIMNGGFVRGGSTQFFPVNCTRVDNIQNNTFTQEGGSQVWKDLIKMSYKSKYGKRGGNKKTLKKMNGGFIRGGSTQFFPVNCTRINNTQSIQPNRFEVKTGGYRKKKLFGGSDGKFIVTKEQRIEINEISKYIIASGDKIHQSFGGVTSVANNIFKEYIKGMLNPSDIVSENVDSIDVELIKNHGHNLKIDNVFGQEGDFDTLKEFKVLRYVIDKSSEGIDVTKENHHKREGHDSERSDHGSEEE